MISSVTNQGKVRFMIYRETMNGKMLIRFLERLVKDAGRKVFLILDNLRVHHCAPVKQWLQENEKLMEVFYLPAYSPERNPDEYLNCDLKAGVHSKPPVTDRDELESNVRSHMRMLQRTPARVQSYFQHESIRYAA
jgi:transposase